MAFGAFAFSLPAGELASVNVQMAIDAVRKSEFFLKVALQMAGDTSDFRVLALERILCFRMVEVESRLDFFPAHRRVAIFAALRLERVVMRIGVAIDAICKLHVLESHRPSRRIGLMTLFASHLDVRPGQRISCLGVVEMFGVLPV